MKLLRCKLCHGEMDVMGNDRSINKKVKCRKCKFSNFDDSVKVPEVVIIKRKVEE